MGSGSDVTLIRLCVAGACPALAFGKGQSYLAGPDTPLILVCRALSCLIKSPYDYLSYLPYGAWSIIKQLQSREFPFSRPSLGFREEFGLVYMLKLRGDGARRAAHGKPQDWNAASLR